MSKTTEVVGKRVKPINGVHLFRKYVNRKIYDVNNACYATLADVRAAILKGELKVVVRDHPNNTDITTDIMLEIIYTREVIVRHDAQLYTDIIRASSIKDYVLSLKETSE